MFVAGSRTVGTDPCFNFRFLANPALYCPSLRKQSEVEWWAHTYNILGVVVGASPSKIKLIHWVFKTSDEGAKKRLLCSFVQPTTEQPLCFARTFAIFVFPEQPYALNRRGRTRGGPGGVTFSPHDVMRGWISTLRVWAHRFWKKALSGASKRRRQSNFPISGVFVGRLEMHIIVTKPV